VSLAPRARTAWWTAAAAGALLVAAPSPGEALAELAHATAGPDPTAPLVAAAALLAWGLAAWLGVTVLVTALGARPGACGQVAAVLARRIAPAAVRRAVELSLGLTVAVGTVGLSTAAQAAVPTADHLAASSVDGEHVGAPPLRLDWPTSGVAVPSTTATTATTATTSTQPTATSTATATSPAPASAPAASLAAPTPSGHRSSAPIYPATQPATQPATAETPPGHAARRPTDPPPSGSAAPVSPAATGEGDAAPGRATTAVVVRPGDSLWAVARRDLQAAGAGATARDVAAAWPLWWAANRQLVGEDPDLLRPGTHLTPPAAP